MATLTGTAGNDTFVLKAFGKDKVVDSSSTDSDLVKASFDHTLAANVENLTLTGNNVMLHAEFGPGDSVDLARVADPANTLVGSWLIDDDSGRSVITFLPDGTYMHIQNGPTDGDGHSGIEYGKYTWNASTHAFAVTQIITDTNGDWGFTDGGPNQAVVEGNILTASFPGEGDLQLTRIVDAGNPLVGTWYLYGDAVPGDDAGGIAMVTFLADGTYMFGQDGDSSVATGDPSGQDGMEYGTYEYNPDTGLVTYNTTTDTSGEWGLSVPSDPGGSFTGTVRGANGTGNNLANTITGDANANEILGLSGNDTLSGKDGADRLVGGGGADHFFGGKGNDVLNGGGGSDKFHFDAPLSSANSDRVQGFETGVDKIVLHSSIFAAFTGDKTVAAEEFKLGKSAADENDYLIYDKDAGKLYYDADGSGEASKKLIATFNGNPDIAATDFKVEG